MIAGGRIFKLLGLLAVACLCTAVPAAHAAQATDDADDEDATQLLAQDIGCIATYDVILAAGRGKIKAQESLRHAREAALEAFRTDSDLPEVDVRAAIAQADQMLPDVLKQSHQTLAQYKTGCDAAFMANPFADSDAQPL